MAKVQAVPEGFHTVTAQLRVDGAAEALAFFASAFGGEELMRAPDPEGKKIWHAVMRIGDSVIFVNDAFPEMGAAARPSCLYLYLEDVDGAFRRAVEAGAQAAMPPMDMFWGDRMARVVDRWGNEWNLAAHVKDLTPEEMQRAQDEFVTKMKPPG